MDDINELLAAEGLDPDDKHLISRYANDPLGFVRETYPWGRKGSLREFDGPDTWQTELLGIMGSELNSSGGLLRYAVRSGHGIGKTALIAWIVHWFISTHAHPQIVVTANTQAQLEGKTWRELAKWWKLSAHRHWFQWTQNRFYHREHPETWFAAATPWSKERSEAFAGTHERNVLMVFDEASLIPGEIWDVAEGAMTTPGAMWVAFGNPTRNTGRFADCFGRFGHRWNTWEVDSRTARMADREQIQKWIDDWGIDSDFVRVRVLGKMPRGGDMQFIGLDLVRPAMGRAIRPEDCRHSPRVIGVDVSRTRDRSVIFPRQGLQVFPPKIIRPRDTSEVRTEVIASHVAAAMDEFGADAVFIDVGYNPGVYDLLKQWNRNVTQVQFGGHAKQDKRYVNKRAEMWGGMKDWLALGPSLPEVDGLFDELTAPEYGFDSLGRIKLEAKEDIRARLGVSPDLADALALTFAAEVAPRGGQGPAAPGPQEYEDYDPMRC